MHRLFARAVLRAQWRALVGLVLLIAVVVAALVAALSAADRSATAFVRLRQATNASAVAVFVDDGSTPATTRAALRRIDGVTAAEAQAELFVRPAGTELFPD